MKALRLWREGLPKKRIVARLGWRFPEAEHEVEDGKGLARSRRKHGAWSRAGRELLAES